MIVLLAAVLVVALGGLFDLPVRRVALMLMLLWAVALLGHLLLPEGHALLRLIGGSARGWGALGVAALVQDRLAQAVDRGGRERKDA